MISYKRLLKTLSTFQCGDSEEEFACCAAQDIARLCAEVYIFNFLIYIIYIFEIDNIIKLRF